MSLNANAASGRPARSNLYETPKYITRFKVCPRAVKFDKDRLSSLDLHAGCVNVRNRVYNNQRIVFNILAVCE